ncbi:hypothetical protein, partial [Pinisolibacter sp.]|uniref:hypothetical protein n=1 Tax=Pinisolibacter sp. TaxID=2172024 RepID=UPI002FDDA5D6
VAISSGETLIRDFQNGLLRLAGICNIMIGSALVGLGRYAAAREHFGEACGLPLTVHAKSYLGVLDGFLHGVAAQAQYSAYDPPRNVHPYIAAKIAHNIIACRIDLMKLDGCDVDLWDTSITPLEQMGSREYTYGINNIAVINLLRGNYETAISLLRYLRDRAYQAYDVCSCENNTVVYAILTGDYALGTEACDSLESLFRPGGFADPTFKMMSYSNIAAFAWRFGDEDLLARALRESLIPANHESAHHFERKKKKMISSKYDGDYYVDISCSDLEGRFVYYPVVLHHWDFFIPPMNSAIIQEWFTPPEDALRIGHD